MASKARALKVLKDGGKIVNGLVCLPSGGLDLESRGRLSPAQLKSLEKQKNVTVVFRQGSTIHLHRALSNMTASQIRAELERLANTTATAADHRRLSQAWETVKGQTPHSYHAVIEDRLRALPIAKRATATN